MTASDRSNGSRARPSRFRLVPFAQLSPREDAPYLIKGLMPRVGLTVVWGPPKSGKSFFTFDAMLHVALGWEYRGHKVAPGAVVYCAMEGAEGYGKRAEAFRQRRLSEHTQPIPFYLVEAPMDLVADHGELVATVTAAIGSDGPVAVVLDTLNRSLRGSESDDKDMAAYVRAADVIRAAFDCAVIVVHHCGIDGTRPRGHTSLTGSADAQLSVKRDKAKNVIVTVEWMKDGPEGEVLGSRLEQVQVGRDNDGDAITSCVVEPLADEAPTARRDEEPARLPKAAQISLRALQAAIQEHGTRVTIDQWRPHAYRLGISKADSGQRAKEVAFSRSRLPLIAAGLVIVDGSLFRLAGEGEQGGEHCEHPS